MPRPGPRPYDCIRRAWHSDRHQPMRGLLIQEIFRIVCEIHSQTTKKNTEWQEKLPVVVLRAEEIMYSKANSEAEYMDLSTLLDRTNDAINTIIRLDDTTETGGFLQPCIEAALHLGCTPRRASRSQRNINPRCYLSQDSTNLDNNTLSPPYQVFMKPNNFAPKNLPVMTFHNDVVKRVEKCPVSKYSSYPLCYSFRVPPLPVSKNVTDLCKSNKNIRPVSVKDATTFGGCDLSLRLGPLGDIRSPAQKRIKR